VLALAVPLIALVFVASFLIVLGARRRRTAPADPPG
jgi:hypothetical protein